MRIKSRWFKPGREHSPQELAGALSFVIYRIADNALKNTRKAKFQIDVGEQYFEFLTEFLLFLILVADRIAYRTLSAEDRALFTGELANRVALTHAENQSRLLNEEPALCKQRFIDRLNLRSGEYAEFGYTEQGPEFAFTRYLAYCMNDVVNDADSIWITEQMMSIETPAAVEMLEKTFKNLLSDDQAPARQKRSGD